MDPQEEFDQLYSQLHRMLDAYYPEHTVTITTSNPPYMTPNSQTYAAKKERTSAFWEGGAGGGTVKEDR